MDALEAHLRTSARRAPDRRAASALCRAAGDRHARRRADGSAAAAVAPLRGQSPQWRLHSVRRSRKRGLRGEDLRARGIGSGEPFGTIDFGKRTGGGRCAAATPSRTCCWSTAGDVEIALGRESDAEGLAGLLAYLAERLEQFANRKPLRRAPRRTRVGRLPSACSPSSYSPFGMLHAPSSLRAKNGPPGVDEQDLEAVVAVAVEEDAGAALGHAGRLRRVHGLEQAARALLDGNWREGDTAARRTRSASQPAQLPVAVVLGLVLPRDRAPPLRRERARRELETLLNARRDGFIGHTILWGRPLDRRRALRYNVASRADLMTRTIQPPLLAWAWESRRRATPARAGHRRAPRLAARPPRLDGRRPAVADPARRVGTGRDPEVRLRLGRAGAGAPAVPALIARNRRLRLRRRAGGAGSRSSAR